jgi:large subunit ribosomal protein L6
MSRIGKAPIAVPNGVTVEIKEGNHVTVKGPKGELSRTVPAAMQLKQENGEITVTRPSEETAHKSLHGLTRTLIANMVEGVTKGFTKNL